jgi:hypothetical protein
MHIFAGFAIGVGIFWGMSAVTWGRIRRFGAPGPAVRQAHRAGVPLVVAQNGHRACGKNTHGVVKSPAPQLLSAERNATMARSSEANRAVLPGIFRCRRGVAAAPAAAMATIVQRDVAHDPTSRMVSLTNSVADAVGTETSSRAALQHPGLTELGLLGDRVRRERLQANACHGSPLLSDPGWRANGSYSTLTSRVFPIRDHIVRSVGYRAACDRSYPQSTL